MKKPERNPLVSTCTEHILFKGNMNKMPCTSIHGAPRRYRHQMKISLPGSGHLSPSYCQGPDALRTRQATAITFGTQHSHERTLLLKPPFTLEAGHKEISPRLGNSPCWLAFGVLGGAVQVAGREKTSMVTSSCGPACYKAWPSRQDMPWCDTDMTVMGTTDCFQTGYEVCSTGRLLCLVL